MVKEKIGPITCTKCGVTIKVKDLGKHKCGKRAFFYEKIITWPMAFILVISWGVIIKFEYKWLGLLILGVLSWFVAHFIQGFINGFIERMGRS